MASSAAFKLTQHLDRSEISGFTKPSNVKAVRIILSDYLIIAACFILAGYYPYWFVYLPVAIVLGSRQLGLAVLMHECAHNSFFSHKGLNHWVGKWLCGAPLLIELDGYRRYHLEHHRLSGTDKDPDYPNYKLYPVSKLSMARKLVRDIVGITGIRNLIGLCMMYGETSAFDLSYKPKKDKEKIGTGVILKNIVKNMLPYFVVHGILISGLILLGAGELYWLWLVTFLTVFSVLLRIRNAAEHAAVPDLLNADARMHTRTTIPPWWQAFILAPHGANYHLEHHLLPSVPAYNLPDFHQLLVRKGLLNKAELRRGYGEVMRELTIN